MGQVAVRRRESSDDMWRRDHGLLGTLLRIGFAVAQFLQECEGQEDGKACGSLGDICDCHPRNPGLWGQRANEGVGNVTFRRRSLLEIGCPCCAPYSCTRTPNAAEAAFGLDASSEAERVCSAPGEPF